MKTTFLIAAVVLTHGLQSAAQSISLFDIDTSAYPTMRAKFYAFDAQGNQQRPAAAELAITENGQGRTITSVTCPPAEPPKALSSVLVIDVSGSMNYSAAGSANIDLAKTAARAWVNGLPLDTSECAVSSFDDANYLNQDFTTNRTKLLGAISILTPGGGTDYDKALIHPSAGGLLVSGKGKYRRVIVLVTDGLPNFDPDVDLIVGEANRQNCSVYAVTLGMPAPQSLKDISSQTGGQYFENVTTVQQAEDVYRTILYVAQGGTPCTLAWQSDILCESGETDVKLAWQGQSATGRYPPPSSAVAKLEFSPAYYRFDRPPIGTPATQTITVTARNAALTVTNITSNNPAYTLTPTSFTLQANESRTLTLTYTAADSGYAFTRVTLENALCPQTFFASGGYLGKKPKTSTLKLTRPNGGETFVVGSDTVITWEGIPATDLVQLEYSADSGKTWKRIDTTRGLTYRWKNVSPPASTRCLVRVRQLADNVSGGGDAWKEIRTLRGHTSWVNEVAFSPDGSMLASAGADKTVKLWNPQTGDTIRTLRGHTTNVEGVSFSPDGSMLASAGFKTVKLWNPQTGDTIRTLRGYSYTVWDVDFSPDGSMLAPVGDNDKTVKLWNPQTGDTIRTLQGHTSDVYEVAFSPDGSMLASASNDKTVKLWNPQTGDTIRTLRVPIDVVSDVDFSPDGSMLASANHDGTVKLWNLQTGDRISTLPGHSYSVNAVDFSPDGSMLASASDDSTVKLWNPQTGREIRTLRGHTSWVRDVAFSPDGSMLASASEDRTVRLWSVGETSIQEDRSDAVFSIVEPLAASRDVDMGQGLVGASKDSVVVDLVGNVGTYPFAVRSITFTGADASAFSLVSGQPVYSVPVGGSRFGELRFRSSRTGLHQAQMVVITQSDTLVQTIRGMGVAPALSVVNTLIDFGRITIGSSKDTVAVATIRNVGSAALAITGVKHAGPNIADFTTSAGGGSFVLQPGQAHTMDLRFTATTAGRTSGSLEFSYNGFGSPAVVQLFGEGVYIRTTISLPQISTLAGQAISLDLAIAASQNLSLPSAPRRFTATIAVNPTVVHVTDTQLSCTQTSATTCYYTVTGVRGDDDTLVRIPAIATLGTTDYAPLELVDFRWLDSVTTNEVTLRNGSIRITGVCDSGGVRLYVPSDAGFSLASRPNPAGATVDFHFSLAGAAPVTIDVVDQTGRVLMSPVSETRLEAGVYTRSVDLSPLSNGPYMLMLRSGNRVLYSRMDVVR